MKSRKIKFLALILYFCGITLLCVGVSSFIALSSTKTTKYVYNANLEKAVDTDTLKESYKTLNEKNLSPVLFDNFYDAVNNAKYYDTSFIGKLTHYGPDCALCGGHLGCNGQDARNGNIYYNDKEYGTVRIVATSKSIPCGSIIRINVDAYDKNGLYAIVLDRGVGPGVVDLLKTSEKAMSPARTVNNARFDIVRYGY